MACLLEVDKEIAGTIALGMGNFHGAEMILRTEFDKRFPGLIKSSRVGFMSPYCEGVVKSPTYEQVSTGTSGHIQVVLIEFVSAPSIEEFEELVRLYFSCHDPTTKYRQGDDRGFQYSSWVFCESKVQSDIVKRIRDELQDLLLANAVPDNAFSGKHIWTNISPMHEFTAASEEHQQYHKKNPEASCQHRLRLKLWPRFDWEEETLDDESGNSFGSGSSNELIKRLRSSRRRNERIRDIIRTSLMDSA